MQKADTYHGAGRDAPAGPPGQAVPLRRLARRFGIPEALLRAADAAFPVRVTRSWANRIAGSDPDDPLARQVLPAPAELDPADGGLDDPVGEKGRVPVPWVVCKHRDRPLLLLTKRCHVYCRYCFRRTHRPAERPDPTPEELDRAIAWCRAAGPEEVILSGGDPLAVRDAHLFAVMDALRPDVPVLRLHTRAPISAPGRVTDPLVEGLARRRPVWVVVHANHPRELSGEVCAALGRLVGAGLPVLNQAVLLAGVNDDVEILADLCRRLVRLGVRPYYLHHPDRVAGAARFQVSPQRGLALHRALAARVSGVALPRYVVDPADGVGKVEVARALAEGRLG